MSILSMACLARAVVLFRRCASSTMADCQWNLCIYESGR